MIRVRIKGERGDEKNRILACRLGDDRGRPDSRHRAVLVFRLDKLFADRRSCPELSSGKRQVSNSADDDAGRF